MNKQKKPGHLDLLSHSARLAYYDASINGSTHADALSRVKSLLPAVYQPTIEALTTFAADDNSASALGRNWDVRLLKQLKHLASSHSGNPYGVLVAYFHQLSQTQTLVQAFWSGLRSIFSYCAAIVVVAIMVTGILITRVLPELEAVFISADAALPEFTRFALQIADHAPFILLGVIILTAAIYSLVRRVKQRILSLSNLWGGLAAIPAFKGLVATYRYFLFLQYSQILAHAQAHHTPALQKELWRLAYGQAQEPEEGTSVHLLHCALTAAGQLGGRAQELEYQRSLIADYLLEQLLIARGAIWAAVITLIGCVVGSVVIAMYLPIFALGSIA